MPPPTYKTPGVYTTELNAFPNSVVGVPTSVPAFIGYTPQANYEGKSYNLSAVKISSFAEFRAIYGFPDSPHPASAAKQYSPEYYLLRQNSQGAGGETIEIAGSFYAVVPDAPSQ